MLKATKGNLQKLEQLFTEQGYTVRYEKGNFSAGKAMVMNNNVVVVNKFFETEGRINALLEIFSSIEALDAALFSPTSVNFIKKYDLLTQKEDNND